MMFSVARDRNPTQVSLICTKNWEECTGSRGWEGSRAAHRMKGGAGESWEEEPGFSTARSALLPSHFCSFLLASISPPSDRPLPPGIENSYPETATLHRLRLGSPKADSKTRVWVQYSIWEMISRGTMRELESETGRRSPQVDA